MIIKIRNNKLTKVLTVFIAFNFLLELILPNVAFALTSGPSQPEVQSFSPVGTSDMVDHFSGDFSYNIPLLDVGGYPVNMVYNSGIGMDQEASWVGLGWNINPGVINRSMRGIPDDFKGDPILKEFNMKTNRTFSVHGNLGFELFGFGALSVGMGIKYNNYAGVGLEQTVNLSVSAGKGGSGPMTAGLGIKSSAEGLDIAPSVSFSANVESSSGSDIGVKTSIGVSFNSRAGLKELTYGADVSVTSYKDHETSTMAGGESASISFGVQSYVPQVSMPMANQAVTISFKPGLTATGNDLTIDIIGSYSQQKIKNRTVVAPAYGFLNLQDGMDYEEVLMDYNREKDGAFTLNTPNLPLTNLTYDIYSVAGHGVAGTYRPFRNDVGYVFDSKSRSTSDSYSLGVEISGGYLVHGGADVNITDVNTDSGKWKKHNEAAKKMKFKKRNDVGDLFEPYYFKQVGEKSVESDTDFMDSYGNTQAIRLHLQKESKLEVKATDTYFKTFEANVVSLPAELPDDNYKYNSNEPRAKRNQLFSFLTFDEAENFGFQKEYYSSHNRKKHHIAEITVLKPDGVRYIYGLPLYNTLQKEVTFNASKRDHDCATGLVDYGSDDNSKNNKRGTDNFFSKIVTPPYAHSYLLTAILSPDYVDVHQDGPTNDDLGSYTVFHYRSPGANPTYKWRVPVGAGMQANFDEGFKSLATDDKGNYIYGEKELMYLDTIKTKNHIAIFYSNPDSLRQDGLGVSGEDGDKSPSDRMLRLDKISLYSHPDYYTNGQNAVPIKEVHFKYNYSLCQGIDNSANGTGKLTLKELYFTYGKSNRAKLSSYKFNYGANNPDYNIKAYDRWGNYKAPNSGQGCGYLQEFTNAEFPYVDQSAAADSFAQAWSLREIKLPSGGTLQISYEADDYAYVQDKPAMQMFKVVAVSNSTLSSISNPNNIEKASLMNGNTVNNTIYFKLSHPISSGNAADTIRLKYLSEHLKNEMYFRFLVNMQKSAKSNSYEYVSGYAKITGWGVVGTDYGYVILEKVPQGKSNSADVHPVSKAAWQYARANLPSKAWDQPLVGENSGIKDVIMTLANSSIIKNIVETVRGPNGTLNKKDYGKEFVRNKSWIRLLNPEKSKKGGGIRVAEIKVVDNWSGMVSSGAGITSVYGQRYSYKMDDGRGNLISSGVAEYEPKLGGDENPWHEPIAFGDKDEKILIPDDEHYLDGPLGESFFPSPAVGYRRVEVQSLASTQLANNGTGKIVHEFFTAYDFPVIIRQTDLNAKPRKTNPVVKLFKFNNKDFMTVSQGYAIELNDMHGKPKSQKVYPQNDNAPLSSIQYFYKTDNGLLDNEVNVIQANGNLTQREVGLEIDLVGDMREQQTRTLGMGISGNLAGFLASIIPVTIPTIMPSFSKEMTRFRSAVITKVIRRYGIIEEAVATDLGSRIATTNLAYDAETGEVLATRTQNEFNDSIYSFSYPAHWAYDGMGQAYKNWGVEKTLTFTNGQATVSNANKYFAKGDELKIGQSQKGWIADIIGNQQIVVIDVNGNPLTISGNHKVKVIRSGRKNQQAIPIGSIVSLTNPLNNFPAVFYDILDANATEFSDDWGKFCECEDAFGTQNKYLTGERGIWRPKKSHLVLTERLQSHNQGNSNIRIDGTYKDFPPFWKINNYNQWVKDDSRWTWTAEVTEHSPYGPEIENVDPLNRFGGEVYGYSQTLSIARGFNTEYKEVAFDGFEDYDFETCMDHFSYRVPYTLNPDLRSEPFVSHSGRYSLKLENGQSVKIQKVIYDPCK